MMSRAGQLAAREPLRLSPRWRTVAELAWVVVAVGFVVLWGIGTVGRLTSPPTDCRQVLCDNIELSAADARNLEQLDLPSYINPRTLQALEVPYSLLFFVTAAVIYIRTSDRPIGLLLSMALIYSGAMLFSTADDPLKRLYPALIPLVSLFDLIGLINLVLVMLTFPDGRLPGRRTTLITGGLMLLVVGIPVASTGSSRLQGPSVPPIATALWLLLFIAVIGSALRSQVHRYRYQSSTLERQQTKWVLFGLAGQMLVVLIWGYVGYAYPPGDPSPARVIPVLVATPLILGISSLVPIAVAFAVLRHRLFDIDRVINRTLVYTLLTGLLAAVYYASVLVLQALFATIGIEQSPLAIVLSTLAIAAMFTPLRRRIQDFIDRRFYRRRYDMQITLATFGMQLRERFDLDSVLDELLGLTEEVLRPEHASLWIRSMKGAER